MFGARSVRVDGRPVTDEQKRDALYALLRHPGWLLVASQVEGRVGFLTAELTRENPSQSRDVLAGMVRELQAVTDWPNATLNKLGVPE